MNIIKNILCIIIILFIIILIRQNINYYNTIYYKKCVKFATPLIKSIHIY